MSGQFIQTWRQIVFAAIVLAFLGATVGTAFGMARTKGADTPQASQHGSQSALTPSVTPPPSQAPPSTDASTDQTTAQCTSGCKTQESGGNQHAVVPSVVGYSEFDARKMINDRGLSAQVRYTCTEQATAGKVTDQSPRGESRVASGSKVLLQVQGATVPNVINLYHAGAKARLENAGFKVQPGASGGAVSAQNPAANSCVKPGSTVTLTIGTPDPPPSSPSTSPHP